MFEFLFKYPAEYFTQGSLVLALPRWQLALIPLGILALAFIVLGYFNLRGNTGLRHRIVIALLRSLAISLVLFSLSRPLLEVTSQLQQPGLVGILLDNSVSMRVEDFSGAPRSELIRQQFDINSSGLLRSIQQQFETRLFKFGEDTQAIADIGSMDFDDGDSDLARALEVAQQSLQGEPLAGLVVISDGAIRSTARFDALLLALRAEQVPVYSIGVGETRYQRDIEISHVRLPHRVLKGSRVVADVTVEQQGYDGETLDLVVEDDGRILQKKAVTLKPGPQSIRIPLTTADSGARQLKFYLANLAGEQIADNNSRREIMSINDDKMRILYFEGEPRFELKFVRRAVADDRNLGVTGLIRTADAKFYRIGIESQQELRNGFPITREELFTYDALILGSVEISLLSRTQQEMIVEFVSERGGGLLLLGGRHAFAEGGYRDSLLRDMLPVVMSEPVPPEFSAEVSAQPTAAALVQPALLIADDNEKSIARWQTLPPLTIVNPITQVKPGATLLLTSAAPAGQDPYVIMASQRYGRGRVIAFPVQNSWIWQMHQDIELADQTHEMLWRQLLRWLVEDVPERVGVSISDQHIHSGGTIKLRSEVLNFGEAADVPRQLRALVTTPTGLEQVKRLAPHPSEAGIYETEIIATDPGDYLLQVELEQPQDVIRSRETRFTVSQEGLEFYGSEMNETLLRKLAFDTNGGFFNASEADRVVDELRANQRGATTLVRYELWDMPLIFLLLVLLLSAEWAYRRWRNLV